MISEPKNISVEMEWDSSTNSHDLIAMSNSIPMHFTTGSIFDECDSNDNYLLRCLLLEENTKPTLLINHSQDHVPNWEILGD